MSNGLENQQTAKLAPPPPPLPAGLTVPGANHTNLPKAAPPPPPLPNGFGVAGVTQNKTPAQPSMTKVAPPPPPLPAGMSAQPAPANTKAPKAAPPPPPLPNGLKAKADPHIQVPSDTPTQMCSSAPNQSKEHPTAPFNVSQGSGRVTMSLADAAREKAEEEEKIRLAEEEAAREAAKPKVLANGGKLDVEDPCFARSSADGLYYFAKIVSFDSEKATVQFFDDVVSTLPLSKIYTVEEAKNAMECFANWSERGNYFPAFIDDFTEENQFSVHYKEDVNMVETLPLYDVRFAVL